MAKDEDGWLDGWEQVNLDTGLTFTGGPGKLALHSAEGSNMKSLINTFKSNPTIASQFSIDPYTFRKVQFISALHAGKALRNLAGGVETNRDMVWQIEIIGFWTEMPNLNEEQLKFIGECIAEIWVATGQAFKLEMGYKPLVGPEDGYTARQNAPQRYSAQEWDDFNGIAGHCNVPENEHTDPGKLNMGLVIFYAKRRAAQILGTPDIIPVALNSEDYEMFTVTNAAGQRFQVRISNQRLVHSWRGDDGKRVPWRECIEGLVVVNMQEPLVLGQAIWIPVVARTAQFGDVLLTIVQPYVGSTWESHGTDAIEDFIKSIQPKQ